MELAVSAKLPMSLSCALILDLNPYNKVHDTTL